MAQVISTLNEKALHAALKAWYAQPGDQVEAPVDGYIIDLVRGGELVEIQVAGCSRLGRKLAALADQHPVRLVVPIAEQKWIVRADGDGRPLSRRRSPKRGAYEHIFQELVSFPRLLAHPHFQLEVLLIHEEEVRERSATRAWRRKGWVTRERRLIQVVGRKMLESPQDAAALLPGALPAAFTTADLAQALGQPRWLAQKMAYCLREMGMLLATGKRGNAVVYERAPLA